LICSFQRHHCHPATATRCATFAFCVTATFFHDLFFLFFSFFYFPSQLCQYCHYHTLFGIKMTASLPSFQRHHCHPTTATPRPAAAAAAELLATADRALKRSQQAAVVALAAFVAAAAELGVGRFFLHFGGVFEGFNGVFWAF
jgi:hypothetical protein